MRQVPRAVAVGALAAASMLGGACGGSGGDGGGSNAFTVGTLELALTLALDGTLPTAASATTAAGVRLDVLAGTRFSTPRGQAITGPVVVRLDDGGEDRPWLDANGEGVDGAWRVRTFLVDGTARIPVDAVYDPPLELFVDPLFPDETDGGIVLSQLDVVAVAPQPPRPPPVGGEPPSGVDWVDRERSDRLAGPVTTVSVPVSTLTGARLNDPSIPPPGFTFTGDVIHEEVLGPVGGDYPRVCCVKVIGDGTSQSLNADCWPPGLFLPGQSRVMGYPGEPPGFLVEIVEVAGQRVLRARSPYKNKFTIRTILYTDAVGGRSQSDTSSTGFSEDEADTGAVYLGWINVIVRACGSFLDFEAAVATVAAALPPGSDVQMDRFRSPDGSYVGRASVHNDTESVRSLASRLPGTWVFTYGDRVLEIDIPWPPARVEVAQPGANVVHTLDPTSLAVVDTTDVLPVIDDFEVTTFGTRYVGTLDPAGMAPGFLTAVDATGTVTLSTPLPLSSGVADDPYGEVVYGVTSDGTFHAFATGDFSSAWSLPGFGAPPHFDVALRADGAFAYVCDGAGVVHEVDVLRRRHGRALGPVPPGVPVVSDDGLRLAVVHGPGNVVHVLDLTTGTPSPFPSGAQPAHGTFTPGTHDLLVACAGSGQLHQVPGSGAPPVFDATSPPGLLSLASYVPAPGQSPVVIGANPNANQFFRGTLTDPAVAIGWGPVAAPPQPTLVRVAGR